MQTGPANTLPAPEQAPVTDTAEDVPATESGLTPYAAPYGTTPACNADSDGTACAPCATQRCCPWYASVSGLVMGRNKPNGVWTTYETGNNPNQLMTTRDTDLDWQGGGDVRIGRFFGCNRWALEFGYWGIGKLSDTQSMTHPNGVSSPLLFQDLEFNDSVSGIISPVQGFFDDALEHRLTRTNEFYNIELNMIQGYTPTARCQKCTGRALLGVRYFQFDEDLILESLYQGVWGGNNGQDEATMSSSVENTMIGVQIGYLLEYRLGCRGSAFIAPKIGLYNNNIKNRFHLYRGDGLAATPSAFSGVAGGYPVTSSKNIASFLSEVDLGLRFRLTERWSLFGGYRVVVLNGVGLSDDQIPQYIVDIPEISSIDSNGSLVIHGAFLGAGFNF